MPTREKTHGVPPRRACPSDWGFTGTKVGGGVLRDLRAIWGGGVVGSTPYLLLRLFLKQHPQKKKPLGRGRGRGVGGGYLLPASGAFFLVPKKSASGEGAFDLSDGPDPRHRAAGGACDASTADRRAPPAGGG